MNGEKKKAGCESFARWESANRFGRGEASAVHRGLSTRVAARVNPRYLYLDVLVLVLVLWPLRQACKVPEAWNRGCGRVMTDD